MTTINLDSEDYQSQLPDCKQGESVRLSMTGTVTKADETGATIEVDPGSLMKEETETADEAAPEAPHKPVRSAAVSAALGGMPGKY